MDPLDKEVPMIRLFRKELGSARESISDRVPPSVTKIAEVIVNPSHEEGEKATSGQFHLL